jgi:hypothetical protein
VGHSDGTTSGDERIPGSWFGVGRPTSNEATGPHGSSREVSWRTSIGLPMLRRRGSITSAVSSRATPAPMGAPRWRRDPVNARHVDGLRRPPLRRWNAREEAWCPRKHHGTTRSSWSFGAGGTVAVECVARTRRARRAFTARRRSFGACAGPDGQAVLVEGAVDRERSEALSGVSAVSGWRTFPSAGGPILGGISRTDTTKRVMRCRAA